MKRGRWRRFGLLAGVAAMLAVPGVASAQEEDQPPSSGRRPLADVPVGCPIQPLPDVVFVGTVIDNDFQTARFRIDQHRAGWLDQFAAGDQVDVRYGIDTKYLQIGSQYLVGASYNPNTDRLESRVQDPPELFGDDEIIGATEIVRDCPDVVDPRRTMHTDGSAVDSGMLSPMINDRQGVLRSIFVPLGLICGAIFALAAVRWILTGFGQGMESLARRSAHGREERLAMRTAVAGGQPASQPQRRRLASGRQPPPPPRRRR